MPWWLQAKTVTIRYATAQKSEPARKKGQSQTLIDKWWQGAFVQNCAQGLPPFFSLPRAPDWLQAETHAVMDHVCHSELELLLSIISAYLL